MFASRTLRAAVLFAAPLAVWLVAGAVPAQTPTAVTTAVPATATMPRVLGDPQAPVEVIEYASLTCHHCATFHNTVLPQVKQELVDTGNTFKIAREKLPKAHYACLYAKPQGAATCDTYITEVSQDTWIHFPWDMEFQYAAPIAGIKKEG